MKKLPFLLFLFIFMFCEQRITPIEGFNYDLAKLPPMGWNSWNCFAVNISDSLIRQVADSMVSSGMKDVGYEYIVIDDGWAHHRNDDGTLVPDPEKFPYGLKSLSDYIHGKGLKFGIYSSAAKLTCQRLPGSYRFEEKDIETFKSWGVDYLKYDWCIDPDSEEEFASMQKVLYPKMGQLMYENAPNMVFSIADGGMSRPWEWANGIGHLWRVSYDINRCWDPGGHQLGFPDIADIMADIGEYSGPGHWNDADMLQVANGCLNNTENISHFSLWCIFGSPLMAGNDLTKLIGEDKEILTNKEAVAINQDPLGIQGKRVLDQGDFEIWTKPLHDGNLAILLFNRSESSITKGIPASILKEGDVIKDIWKNTEFNFSEDLVFEVEPHGVRFFRTVTL